MAAAASCESAHVLCVYHEIVLVIAHGISVRINKYSDTLKRPLGRPFCWVIFLTKGVN